MLPVRIVSLLNDLVPQFCRMLAVHIGIKLFLNRVSHLIITLIRLQYLIVRLFITRQLEFVHYCGFVKYLLHVDLSLLIKVLYFEEFLEVPVELRSSLLN